MNALKKIILSTLLLLTGFIIAFLLITKTQLLTKFTGSQPGERMSEMDSDKPLYWVAPMDPNYRRDEAGQSPMGMDLIPFYGEKEGSSPGTISIHPDIQFNLGLRTAKVSNQKFNTRIQTIGYVVPDADYIVHQHSRVKGWIEKLYVKSVGEKIEKGQVLYEIYSPELVNAQEELLIALNRNNQFLVDASTQRLQALQLSQAQIKTLKKEKNVKQAVKIYAKESGIVTELNIVEGYYIQPGMTLMSIADLEHVWVETQIFESQSNLLSTNMKATMTFNAYPSDIWEGKLDYIYPELNAKNRNITARIKLPNKGIKLKLNMFADVTLSIQDTQKSLQIPTEALIRLGDTNRVVVKVADNKFKTVNVTINRINANWAEIKSGLLATDTVVTSSQFMIDSESSKSSDFKRFTSESNESIGEMESMTEGKMDSDSVWVSATINSINSDTNKINIDHPSIEQWKWPAMTMNFNAGESLDLTSLKENSKVEVQLSKKDKKYYIVAVKSNNKNIAMVASTINTIDIENLKANISHPPIEAFKWPAMKMNFSLADNIDLSDIKEGMDVMITIEKNGKKFMVIDINPIPKSDDVDHSGMDHSSMGH